MKLNSTLPFTFVVVLLFFALVNSGKAGWVLNQPLTTTRYYHTATLLPTGKILVAGGMTEGSFAPLASAELYDPISGTCTAVSPMLEGLSHQTATLLPNGKVLIAGGVVDFSGTTDCEIYDPVSSTWTNTGSLNTARFGHTATLLQSGKVLVAGGTAGSTTATAELYDYTTGKWTSTPSMATARTLHCATLLTNGEVLVTGGQQGSFPVTTLSSAEIYDPVTNVWHAINPMLSARSSHTATLLPSGSALFAGKVLVTGGTGTTACELYNPATGTWAATASMAVARTYHTASVLPNGDVIVTGGTGADGSVTNTSETLVTSGGTGSWLKPVVMNTARSDQTATLVPEGRVVVIGGMGTNTTPQSTTETLYLGDGIWSLGGGTYEHALGGAATLLPSGEVIVAGGYDSNLNEPAETDLYDPSTGTWTATGNVSGNHLFCSLTLLQNGEVYLTGDFDSTEEGNASQGELYNPATGEWSDLGAGEPWLYYTATLLLNGKVLFAGGVYFADRGFTYPTNLCYLFDPATQKFTPTGSLNEPRTSHTATLLTNGKVLVAGGADGVSLQSYEIYDPNTGAWTLGTNGLTTTRSGQCAVLLPNGKVLLSGGDDFNGNVLASAEIFDPVAGKWQATGSMNTDRALFTMNLLPNGQVLATDGANAESSDGVTDTSELYDPASGTWQLEESTSAARERAQSVVLTNGEVCVLGGYPNPNGSELYPEIFDTGIGANASRIPQIINTNSFVHPGGPLTLNGTLFRDHTGGSGGNQGSDSSTDYPVVELRSIETTITQFLPAANWNSSSFVSVPVTNFPAGPALATVFVNGIESASEVVQVTPAPSSPIILTNLVWLPSGTFQFSFTNTPNAFFRAFGTTNIAAPSVNWTFLGSPTEISPGDYQFADSQATNSAQRFYRVQTP